MPDEDVARAVLAGTVGVDRYGDGGLSPARRAGGGVDMNPGAVGVGSPLRRVAVEGFYLLRNNAKRRKNAKNVYFNTLIWMMITMSKMCENKLQAIYRCPLLLVKMVTVSLPPFSSKLNDDLLP